MLSIAVCDDEELHRKRTVALIRNMPGFENSLIREFSRAENLLDSISEDSYLPDIAVLDILMDEIDGIDLAVKLNRLVPECQIIFLTGYISYATRAYDAEHAFYVLKAETDSRIGAALNKAAEKRRASSCQRIIINTDGASLRLLWDQVQYLERVLRRTKIVTADGELWTSCPPSDIVSQLDSRCYCQCHKSFYVNTACLAAMLPTEFILQSGLRVPISRSYKKAARESFLFSSGVILGKI